MFTDLIRFPLGLGALLIFSVRATAQGALPAPTTLAGAEIQLLQWGVTQGGLVAVVLVVIWSYRRDFHRLFGAENVRSLELIKALQASTNVMASHAELMREQATADREHAKAFQDLSTSIRQCEAVREQLLSLKTR
jgi:hypothetical protein